MDDVITLDHTVELYIPTHCRCGQKLPEALRDTVTRDTKKQFNAWFKGFSVQHGVPGNWASPDRKHAEEAFDIVYSTCEHDTLEAVTDDVKALAVSVADRLNQDRVALVIDGRMLLYPSSRRHAPCLHETAARLESAPKDLDKAMQVGNPAGKLDRLQAIHALVQRDWCENTGLQAARDLFCGLLGYEYAGGHLPCFRWPDTLSRHLAAIPTILADANGFKVVYLQLSREKLLRMPQREVITRILHDDPSFRGLFLVSCKARKHWELVNARISSESTRGLILRRLQIGVSDGGRTTTERLAIVDITDEETLESAAIQLRHDDAFDVEAVTREFYKDYARVFEQIEARLSTGLDAEERRRFVQTLFNRLMFLRFVERKGWMKLDGRTRRDYLRALYRAGQNDEKPFYQNRLRRLFFEGLAKEKDQPTDLIGHVPFLNGGLFEESALDKKVRDIAGEAFEPLIGTNGLLYRYNFTVLESTPLDVEVAVDPEMLGKVFEELVTGRHESGAYYTPRPIVAFMCREALKGHLLQKTDCSSDAIAALVDDHDVKGISPVNAGQIVDALEHLKAVDPACGSGAYLLGLLHEMVSLYQLLFREELVSAPRSLYDLKLHIISHNLYGVDIDPLAVNIAMLRLWLSLIVEFEGNNPPSLPNLDFKIECGDSLSGPNPEALPDLLGDYLRKQAIGLAKEKDNYLRAHGKLKEVLQASITKHQKRIARDLQSTYGPGIIDWAVNFAEVFATNTGFDIVLANPPYVRKEEIRQALKEKLKANFSEAITGQSDLYCSFYARGVQILREGGMHVFVCSSSWLDATYGRKLQSFLLERCTLIAIYDSAVEKQFSTANINTIISIAQKGKREFNARFVLLKKPFFDALTNPNLRSEYVISQKELFDSASREGVYLGEKWGGKISPST